MEMKWNRRKKEHERRKGEEKVEELFVVRFLSLSSSSRALFIHLRVFPAEKRTAETISLVAANGGIKIEKKNEERATGNREITAKVQKSKMQQ